MTCDRLRHATGGMHEREKAFEVLFAPLRTTMFAPKGLEHSVLICNPLKMAVLSNLEETSIVISLIMQSSVTEKTALCQLIPAVWGASSSMMSVEICLGRVI